MDLVNFFEENYSKIRVKGFDRKFLDYSGFINYLDNYFPEKEFLGKSFLGKPLYLLKFGKGEKKIFIWSQMHGNESTGTRAMLDVIEFLKFDSDLVRNINDSLTVYFLPVLNPDGACCYMRRNACGIDINRDYIKDSSPEIRVLKEAVLRLNPEFLFNLHDQRTIFNVKDSRLPATISFLAPSPDSQRSVTAARLKAMDVIASIANGLERLIPGQVARFSDEFYPTSTGDNFMKAGFSNLLFEAGHFQNDYNRNQVRKLNSLAILLAFQKIAANEKDESSLYLKIPENDQKALDIILRNVCVKSEESESIIDIGIYFEEKPNLIEKDIELISKIEEIGDLSSFFGHIDLDLKGDLYVGNSESFPVIGKNANFSVGSVVFENGKHLAPF